MNDSSRRFKIALFLPSLEVGGAERVFVSLANAFAEKGYSVDFLLVRLSGPLSADLSDKVNIIDLNKSRGLKCFNPLIKYLNTAQPQVLFSSLTHLNLVSIIAGCMAKTKPRIVVREASLPELTVKSGSALRNWLVERLVYHLYSRADAIVCVSTKVKEEFLELLQPSYSHKFCVIFNPIDRHRGLLRTSDLPEYDAQGVHLPESIGMVGPFIVAVGRLVPVKGFEILLRAFSIVKLSCSSNISLCLIGDGPELEYLKGLAVDLEISKNVYFAGYLEQPHLLVQRSSVFVLSSLSEGLPNSLIEAISLRIPSVCSDISSVREDIVRGSGMAITVSPNDPQALAEGITQALKSGDEWVLSERWLDRFALDAIVEKYLALMCTQR